ncbi:hypothetical protein CEXT_38911 [Caerostris extrusa]|uniref:Uncharacterized protein n=1 Tax=Caerostris extrusa TaxID=172846 RepID=A0AAV4NZ44_CAEEX|nr:hypothetical protein CEXT_38911 [Caerostris extrusa]
MPSVNHLNRRYTCVSIKIGSWHHCKAQFKVNNRIQNICYQPYQWEEADFNAQFSTHIVRKRPIQICSSTINVERRTTTAQSIRREISRNFESPNIHRDE